MAFVRGAAIALITSGLLLGGCSSLPFGKSKDSSETLESRLGIGVNAYLWRASLDTLSFMPVVTADPWGGVINYDWYVNPQVPNERFKTTVLILDRRLRADALTVNVVKEVRDPSGNWLTAEISPQTEADLRNAILTRARQLNLANAAR